MISILVLSAAMICSGCGGGGGSTTTGGGNNNPPPQQQTAATPTITATAAQAGAQIVTITDSTSGATIYYTVDGTTPTTSSMVYYAPMLISSNMTLNAIAVASNYNNSAAATKAFSLNITSNTLVWSDEFNGSAPQPDASSWAYDTGFQCCGNNEQETYCAYGSTTAPCDPANPNAYVGGDGLLHVVARKGANNSYTSARLKSQGRFSFMYGRVEAKMKLPESQGMWPAFWLLGNNITKVNWPACGELDVMEHINGSAPAASAGGPSLGYDWIAGSVHGGTGGGAAELNGTQTYHPAGFSAADWHTYGMIWKKGEIDFYVDDPANIYTTFKSTDSTWSGNMWPFDAGPQFIILNLAVGGDWPGNVDGTTVLPSDMQVDWVRIYTN
jgi:beta-glucanase (GH16 family)